MALSDDTGALGGIGLSAASGNLLGAGIGIVGLGLSIFGGMDQSKTASQVANLQGQVIGQEGQINAQKQVAMQMSARRQNLENVRIAQQANARAIAGATAGGAQFGSGLKGGEGQIEAQSLTNMQGVNQGLQIGQNIFGIDQTITGEKQQISALQSRMATDQGLSSLGSSIGGSGAAIGRLSQGFKLT